MQSYTWARTCAGVFPNDGLRIVTAGEPKALRAIAALVETPGSGTLLPLGHELYEPTEFAYADATAAEGLSESLARLGKPVLIRDMLADSIMVESLRRAAGRRLATRPWAGHPWLELDDTWLEPESHLNAGRRSDLRRAQRNAAKVGPVSCEITAPAPATLAPLLRDAFRVESAGWKGGLGSALATDPMVGGFYAQFAQAACQFGTLRIGVLRIGARAAAMQLAVEQDGCFWLLKMGFDESFARFSPGNLLMVESLRSARQRGCNRYELMGKSEAWNQIWTRRLHEAITLTLCAPGVRGWVNVITEHTTGAIKTQVRHQMDNYSVGRRIRRIVLPMMRLAARSYIAGPELQDALAMAGTLATHGRASTIAFWDDVGAAPGDVLDAYLESARALQARTLDSYVSVKAPSVHYSQDALLRVIGVCEGRQTRLHFDSLWPESAEPTRALIDSLLPRYANISFTLPGCWQRSLEDADWAISRGIGVRVVKGQWADPAMPWLDPRKGFLGIIERLAGRARSVAVAAHNPALAARALEQLMKTGTPCELELLFGLPSNAVLRIADAMGVRTRVYVPYGYGWLPYSWRQARRNPQILWWLLKDAMRKKPEAGLRP